jgi:hypothetical protein
MEPVEGFIPPTDDEEEQFKQEQRGNLDRCFAAATALSGLTIGDAMQVHIKHMVDLAVMNHQGNVKAAIEDLKGYTTKVFDSILEDHGKPKLFVPH